MNQPAAGSTNGEIFMKAISKIGYFFSLSLLIVTVTTSQGALGSVPTFVENLRAMSMGRALTAVADDENALFFNPAGLSGIKDSRFTFWGLITHFNSDTFKTTQKLFSAHNKADDWGKLSPGDINDLKQYDPIYGLSGPISLRYIHPYFAASILTKIVTLPEFEYAEEKSTVWLTENSNTIIGAACGFPVYRGISAGITAKYIIRTTLEREEIENVFDGDAELSVGRGLSMGLGLLYSVQWWRLRGLKFGLSLNDIIGTELTWDDNSKDPDKKSEIPGKAAFGIAYRPDWKLPYVFPYFPHDMLFSIDVSDDVRFGMEMKLNRWLALRTGYDAGFRVGLGLTIRQTVLIDYMYAQKFTEQYMDRKVSNIHSVAIMLSY